MKKITIYAAGLFQILPEETKKGVQLSQPMGVESLYSPDTFYLEGEKGDVERVKKAIDHLARKGAYGD